MAAAVVALLLTAVLAHGAEPACTITGTTGDDTLTGTGGPDVICGLAGADLIRGAGGDDILRGDAGDDRLIGGTGADVMQGGADSDAAQYTTETLPVTVTLGDGANDGVAGEGDDVRNDVERIFGGSDADTLTGNADANTLIGNGGGDTLSGGGEADNLVGGNGSDGLNGGSGTDRLVGDAGSDTFTGGLGSDTADYDGVTGDVTASIGDGANDGPAGETDDIGPDVEHIGGGSGDDTLTGSSVANTLAGGAGDDTLHGLGGPDTLLGEGDADTIWAGPGSDTLNGGSGADTLHAEDDGPAVDALRCGTGADVAFADPPDTLTPDCENTPPVAQDDARTRGENSAPAPVPVVGNDFDQEGRPLSVGSIGTVGTVGSATLAAGVISYGPNGQFEHLGTGQSATDTFTYRATDGQALSDPATVTVTIEGVNDAPIAVDDAKTTNENTILTAGGLDVLGNDDDPDAPDTPTVKSVNTSGTQGTVAIAPGGTGISYDPSGHFDALAPGESAVDTFTYTITDAGGATDSATVTVTVEGVNDAPVGAPKAYNAVSNTTFELHGGTPDPPVPTIRATGNLLTGATDVDNGDSAQGIVAETVASTGGGTAVIDGGGHFTYMSEPGETAATDTFTYHLTDTNGGIGAGTVTMTLKERVWYVDNTYAGANGPANGTSTRPFTAAAPAAAAGTAGDKIFVYEGSGPTPGGVVLKARQSLLGQGEAFTVELGGSGTPNGTKTLEPAAGRPQLTTAGADVVTLATGTKVRALNLDPEGADAGGLFANYVAATANTVTIANVDVADSGGGGTGPGMELHASANSTFLVSNMQIATQNARGIFATSAGKLSISGVNTIASGSGTGLTVQNTTILPAGLRFRRIDTSGAPNGIVLTNTGSTGALNVVGTSSPNSGGTLGNSTGPGVLLANTGPVSLTRMRVVDGGDDGIQATSVPGLELDRATVTGNGNAVDERGLDLVNVTGSSALTAVTVSGSADDNAALDNATGSSALTVLNSTFASNSPVTGADGLRVRADGPATMNVDVQSSTFTANRDDHFQAATSGANTATLNVLFSGNTLSGGGGVTVNPGGGAATTAMVSNNTITGAILSAITVNADPSSTSAAALDATVSGNTIGDAATAGSGSAQASGIRLVSNGAGTTTTALTGNTVRQYAESGISVFARDGAGPLNTTITGNTVTNPGPFALEALTVTAGATATDTSPVCADIGGAGGLANAVADMRVRQRFSTTVNLPGYSGPPTDATAVGVFLSGRNGGAAATASGSFTGTGTACPGP